jgi:phosphoesterase RecJ-like protein
LPAPDWKTNTSIPDLAAFLRGKRRIIVLTHVKPDGDAVGSTLALVRALNKPQPWVSGQRAQAWYFGPQPPWLRAIANDTPHRVLTNEGPPADENPDAVVILDTGSWAQLEAVQEWLQQRRTIASVVDHHVQGDPDVAPRLHIDTTAAAVVQPVAKLCCELLSAQEPSKLPPDVAEALYLGLATDTGWFHHSNVSRAVMNLAGELLDAGANHVRLYQCVEQQESVGRLKLLARALASLELHDKDRLAIMTLTKSDYAQSGAQPGESGGFVDFGQSIPTVQVTCLLTEASPSEFGSPAGPGAPTRDSTITKVSLRSKATEPAVDVNVIAKALGGGGHIRAAGARTMQSIDQTKSEIIKLVAQQTH